MPLWLQAAADAKAILADVGGFARPITITSPAGFTVLVTGTARDISTTIDPATGAVVSARTASITIPIEPLSAAGLSIPRNVPDKTSKPWLAQFYDAAGVLHVFKICESHPDLTLGIVTCLLETYRLAP
ncbi:MAG TPA: hypothetical protein VFQ61_06695 [Polyangiaceae bacterium]|nr:hypothetical protein [Polyangiaceae bacterium]